MPLSIVSSSPSTLLSIQPTNLYGSNASSQQAQSPLLTFAKALQTGTFTPPPSTSTANNAPNLSSYQLLTQVGAAALEQANNPSEAILSLLV